MKIPISKPYFDEEDFRLIQEPLSTGWVVQGPKVAEFESLFRQYTGTKFALAATSCTTALHMALMALGIGPGDEVILPPFTWVATANVVEIQRAKPVFVDIELGTFQIDVSLLERAITPRTKAILPVSIFGSSAPMQPILDIARHYGLKVIEDDACATGTWYNGKHAGLLADIGCFSFHPRKAITTGEGGMAITQDENLAGILASIRDHGSSKKGSKNQTDIHNYLLPDFDIVGSNYRMNDLQGALGVAQMHHLEWILEQRIRLANRYTQAFINLKWLCPSITPEGCIHGYQSYVCLFKAEEPTLSNIQKLNTQRNKLMDQLDEAGIATRPGTHAVHMLSYYRNTYRIQPQEYPNAFFADQLTIALPLYAQMTEEEQDFVIERILNYPL